MDLQFGIDTGAHIGALEAKGNTIAVLGCGLENIFPKENIELFNKIIKNNGLIISEYAADIKPCSKNFLERNRIVSALSLGVLVIEAAYRSGTSVTCKYAKEQNKKIFCIPHSLGDKHGVGTNKLIKEGAQLITSTEDIIESLDFSGYRTKSNEGEKVEFKHVDKRFLDIYSVLNGPPLNVEQICNKVGKTVNEVNESLFMLELEGVIEKTQYGYQIK